MVQMSIVSSDTQVNISKVKYFKIRKQVLSFQYTMVPNTPSYSSRQECTLLFTHIPWLPGDKLGFP